MAKTEISEKDFIYQKVYKTRMKEFNFENHDDQRELFSENQN